MLLRTPPNELLLQICAGSACKREVTRFPKVVLAVAHPDDEVIGAGARLVHWSGCHVVYVTDGAPQNMKDAEAAGFPSREAYRDARRAEAHAALALAGVPPGHVHELGFVDQQAAVHLVALVRSLLGLLTDLRPDVVVTHPYEGGHPDHDATAFAVHAASRLLAAAGGPAPIPIEMTSYHSRGGHIETGEFLSGDSWASNCDEVTVELALQDRSLKQRMLACHRTQAATLQHFSTEKERFRLAPRYDFTRPPHGGMLFYEQFDWGITSQQWCDLARSAILALDLEERG